jgi:hypothetical protein
MTDPKAVLRDWQCKPKPPTDSGSIITLCLICFCPSNAPYVCGFVLNMAFAPIAGRGWFWRGFYAMGCNLFGATLIFPFNAMTDGGFCSMIWQVFSRLLTMRLGTNASRVK